MQIGYKIVLSAVVTAVDAPKIVAFLKRAGVFRQHTRGLFLQLFTSSAVLSGAFYLFRCLAATDAADMEAYYLSPHDLDMAGIVKLTANLLDGDRHRWGLRLAHLLSGVALGSLTYIAFVFAAVASRSGEHHTKTLSSLLRKVKSNLLRPALIFAGGCALRAAVMAAVVLLNYFLETSSKFLGSLLRILFPRCDESSWFLIIPITVHKYVLLVVMLLVLAVVGVLQAVCAVAVVASMAESGLSGKDAVARACRLMRGKYAQAIDSMASSSMLGRASWLLYALVGMAGLPASGAVKCLLLIAQEMICVANITEYYFECRNREEQEGKAGHRD